jgi:hypothetical protein
MSRKTTDDWKNIVEQQVTSDLLVSKLCQQHQLSAKYFYTRKGSKLVRFIDKITP